MEYRYGASNDGEGEMYEGEWKCDRRHGSGVHYYADGRADVCSYENNEVVGEGTRWSCSQVMLLVDGRVCSRLSVGEGLEINALIGVNGVPNRMIR